MAAAIDAQTVAGDGSAFATVESGGTLSQAGFFGNQSMPLVGAESVPEPSAAMSLLTAFGVAAGWLLRRRK